MLRYWLIALASFSILVACAVREEERPEDCPPTERATCISGQQVSCPCLDGTMGVQTCGSLGYFSRCECPATGVDDAGDASVEADVPFDASPD